MSLSMTLSLPRRVTSSLITSYPLSANFRWSSVLYNTLGDFPEGLSRSNQRRHYVNFSKVCRLGDPMASVNNSLFERAVVPRTLGRRWLSISTDDQSNQQPMYNVIKVHGYGTVQENALSVTDLLDSYTDFHARDLFALKLTSEKRTGNSKNKAYVKYVSRPRPVILPRGNEIIVSVILSYFSVPL